MELHVDARKLQDIANELLRETQASRTTIRVENAERSDLPVAAETLSEGMSSVKGKPVVRRSPPGPLEYLETERRILVQNDVTTSLPIFPEIIENYGVRAQMLAPILSGAPLHRLIAIVSVHSANTREWSAGDVAAVERAAREVRSALGLVN
jgi:maleate isomerase